MQSLYEEKIKALEGTIQAKDALIKAQEDKIGLLQALLNKGDH